VAEMGTRKIAKVKLTKPRGASKMSPLTIPISGGLNIFIPVTRVVTVMSRGFERPAVGLPIMREGFVTTTGFLQSSPTAVKGGSA